MSVYKILAQPNIAPIGTRGIFTNWNVPKYPNISEEALIYIWPGMNQGGNGDYLIQPVLQTNGPDGAWSIKFYIMNGTQPLTSDSPEIGTWEMSGPGNYSGAAVELSPNDTISAAIDLQKKGAVVYDDPTKLQDLYNCWFAINADVHDGFELIELPENQLYTLTVGFTYPKGSPISQLTTPLVVLEAWHTDSCDQYPSNLLFYDLQLKILDSYQGTSFYSMIDDNTECLKLETKTSSYIAMSKAPIGNVTVPPFSD